jgi:hypothetical protein
LNATTDPLPSGTIKPGSFFARNEFKITLLTLLFTLYNKAMNNDVPMINQTFAKTGVLPQRIGILFFLSLCCVAGCANHLDVETQPVHSVERKIVRTTIEISGNVSLPLATPYLDITATEHRQGHVVEYDGIARYDVYTPYQGWRKIYEIPAGLVLLPVAIVATLVPTAATGSLLDRSIAGMNPFENMADKSRSERTLLDKKQEPFDERDEYSAIPLAGATLTVRGYHQVEPVVLDENGKARISLLDLYHDEAANSTIELSIANDGISRTEQWLVASDFDKKLRQAKIISTRLQSLVAQANPQTSRAQLENFAHDINALSDLGFVYDAKRLQENFANQLDEPEKIEFAGLLAGLNQ